MLLLPRDFPHRALVIGGDAGWGKGTILRLVEGIFGTQKVGILREQLFTDKYEDIVSADVKGQPEPVRFHGDFGIIICSNSVPRIFTDGDEDAWKRRLAIIEVQEPRNGRRIGKLSEILSGVEKSAILNWALLGRQKVIQNGYQIRLSALQEQRVARLVQNAMSDTLFVQECLVEDPNAEITAEGVRKAYVVFCRERGFEPIEEGFVRRISEEIRSTWGVHQRHSVLRQGKARRGWRGLKLVTSLPAQHVESWSQPSHDGRVPDPEAVTKRVVGPS